MLISEFCGRWDFQMSFSDTERLKSYLMKLFNRNVDLIKHFWTPLPECFTTLSSQVTGFIDQTILKAILRLFIYKALYDWLYRGSKTTMTTGEWSCLISFAWDPLSCSEQAGIEKFKIKYMSLAGFEPILSAPRPVIQRLRPLGHAG